MARVTAYLHMSHDSLETLLEYASDLHKKVFESRSTALSAQVDMSASGSKADSDQLLLTKLDL